MANEQTVLRVIRLLSVAFPSRDVTEELVMLYSATLKDIPDDVLEAATLDVISRNIFFPSIGEIRAAAVNIATGIERYQTAAEAWGEVSRAIVRYGRDRQPQFENPVTEKTVNALGWRNLCLSTNQISDRARFIEAYNTYLQRARDDATMLPQVRALAEKFRAPGMRTGWIAPALPGKREILPDPADFSGAIEQERLAAFDRGDGEY